MIRVKAPVSLDRKPRRRHIQSQRMPGGQRLDAFQDSALAVIAIPMNQKTYRRIVVGFHLDAGKREQPFDLRSEDEMAFGRGVIERLDPQPVTRAEEAAAPPVPDRKSIHPLQSLQAIFAPMQIGLQQRFRVRVGFEAVPERFQPQPQFPKVVDLAVENYPGRAVGRGHRLKPAIRQIENRQTAMPESDARAKIWIPPTGVTRERVFEGAVFDPSEHKAFAIWATVCLQIIHPLQSRQIDWNSVETDGPYDATHILLFRLRRRRLPHHRPVDVNHLLGEQPLVQALDRLMASDPPTPSEHSFKRGGDGFGSLVGADLTAFDTL